MKFAKIIGVALDSLLALVLTALALSLAAPMAHADMANQMTKLVFSQPVQIPGNKVLPAGTYWFRIADVQNPNAVMIYDANRTHVDAIVQTRPTYRSTELGHGEVALAQAESGRQPATLIRWFYPGMESGHAFVYSPRTENRIHHEIVRNIIVQPTTTVG